MILTKLLLEKGLLTQGQLDEALAVQQAEVLRLDRAIVQLGFLTERQLLEVMAEELHLPFMSLADLSGTAKGSGLNKCISSLPGPHPSRANMHLLIRGDKERFFSSMQRAPILAPPPASLPTRTLDPHTEPEAFPIPSPPAPSPSFQRASHRSGTLDGSPYR